MKSKQKKIIIFFFIFILIGIGGFLFMKRFSHSLEFTKLKRTFTFTAPTSAPALENIPMQKLIENDYQVFQSFNNCGPASLSMALSYYGIYKTQVELGEALRPYQVASGDNDDKSVTLIEMSKKAEEFGLVTYHRPNGSIHLLKKFIANDIPVITQTWLHIDEDIGHYRVIKGYNDVTNELTQDDSFEGHNLRFTYDVFNRLWEKYNYEYLVLVPKDKVQLAESILGDDVDEKVSWQKAIQHSKEVLATNPGDVSAGFNLSISYYYAQDYANSVATFEEFENRLSPRTLWYQIEPLLAYFELGNYDRVFSISDKILKNGNRAFSELYIIRGEIYEHLGQKELARQEYEKAVLYNKNLKDAQDHLNSL